MTEESSVMRKGWGLIDGNLIAIDGTKIRAQNSKHNCLTKSGLDKKIAYKDTICEALESLQAGGSTNGAGGIVTAYELAEENFISGGNNRVIIATDGDFNVGLTNESDLHDLITEEKDNGIYLSCLGFGMGNYNDATMETLADDGNGNYAYIGSISEMMITPILLQMILYLHPVLRNMQWYLPKANIWQTEVLHMYRIYWTI